MHLLSSILMFGMAVLLFVPSFTEANALTLRKNRAPAEVETSTVKQEDASLVNRTQTTSRGTVKFHMKTPFFGAERIARRPRVQRVRSTTMRSNSVFRDSIETDISLEDLRVVSFQPITANRIWRTSTTPRPIFEASLEKDDVKLRSAPVINRNPIAANRFNRFRTTTVPTLVARDSLEQDDDTVLVLPLEPAVSRLEKTRFSTVSRFNRYRTAAARNLVSRDSAETNDVSLEDLISKARPTPMVNQALSAPKSRGRIQMKTSLGAISPSTSTVAATTPADSMEKTDISLEDLEKITLVFPATTLTVGELETASTEAIGTTTMPTTLVSLQSDEQDDVFITDRTTVTPEPTSDLVGATATMAQLTTQSDEQMDFERVKKLVVALDGTQSSNQITDVATTTFISEQSDEQDDWTVSMPTTTMTPPVTRSSLLARGPGRLQSLATTNQIPMNRLNRVRSHPIKSSESRHSDEQEDETTTTPEPASDLVDATVTMVQLTTQSDEQMDLERVEKLVVALNETQSSNQITDVATTTFISEQSDEQDDWTVSMPTTIMAPPVTRSPLVARGRGRLQSLTPTNQILMNRLNRVRSHPIKSSESRHSDEQEDKLVKHTRIPASRNRFSRFRSTTVRPLVFNDSVERNDVSLEDLVIVVPASHSPLTGSRFNRFRTTTTASPVAGTVGQEAVTLKSKIPKNRSRFSRVRTTTERAPVSMDSFKEDSLNLANKFSRTKASQASFQPTTSNGPKVMSTGHLQRTRGRSSRGRTTTPATPIARHSLEDFSLEDALKASQPLSIQQPASIPVTIEVDVALSKMSRHSDEHDDAVTVPVTSTFALVIGVTDADVSDDVTTTMTLDPVSRESDEKEGTASTLTDEAVVSVTMAEMNLKMIDQTDVSDEAPHMTTVNSISNESDELPFN